VNHAKNVLPACAREKSGQAALLFYVGLWTCALIASVCDHADFHFT